MSISNRRLTPALLLRRSLRHRLSRSVSALVALTVSATIATALLTLYADLDQKLHHTFRTFGPNLVLTLPTTDPALPQDMAKAEAAAGPAALSARQAFAVATTDRSTPVVVAGVDFPAMQRLDSWWNPPAWPTDPHAALLGQQAAEHTGNEKAVTLTFGSGAQARTATFAGSGRLQTGGPEETRIYLALPAFTAWTGVQPNVLEMQVPGGESAVNAATARLRAALPQAQVAPVRQLVEGESRIVDRTHALMFAAVTLIALTVAVSVLATLSASVLERRRDFALMKALGSSEPHLLKLFLLEILLIALAGVAAGYLLGSGAAALISQLNFGTLALPRLGVLPAVLLLNGAIALLAATLPLQSLRNLQPATLLRGD